MKKKPQNNKVDFTKFDLETYVHKFAERDTKRSRDGDAWYICPFHEEKTASLHVTNKQVYHCHGCGKSGGILDFVKDINKIDTKQAMRIIADHSGQESVVIDDEPQAPVEFFVPSDVVDTYSYNGGFVLKYRLPKGYIWAHFKDDTWWVGTGDYDVELYAPNGLKGTVVLAEGEKDANTLCAMGFNGASSPNGTYKWKDSYTEELKDARRIVLLNDEDYIGIASSQRVQHELKEAGYQTKRISPFEILDTGVDGYDITDVVEDYGFEETKMSLEYLIEKEDGWNVLWNEDPRFAKEIPQVDVVQEQVKEIVEAEVVEESGLGDDYDLVVEKAVQETLNYGFISEKSEIDIKKQSDALGIGVRAIKNRIKFEVRERKQSDEPTTLDSKVMKINELDLEIDITGSGYVVDQTTSGIYNENGDEIIGHFLGFAGVVIDAETDQDTNVKVALAYNTPQNLNKMQLVVVPKKILATSLDMIKVLSGYNINVSQSNGLQVITYLQDLQNFFNERTITMKSLSRFGWFDGYLMPYEQDKAGIIFDSTVAQPTANKLLETKGSREKSLELIKDVTKHSETGATMVGAAVGSLILSFINDGGNQSFALNVWAGTGTGKSVTSQAVASMFGYPFKDGFWADGNATMNKDIYHNALLAHIPTFIDDPQRNRGYNSEQKRDYIYAVTSGQGRGRMQRSGDVAQDVREWCNIMIMTNETPFIDNSIPDGGARARCLEINFGDPLGRETINKWIDLMTNNYGHFALELANEIRSTGKYALEGMIKDYIKWFNENGVDGKRAYNAAVVMTGLDLITMLLDLEHVNVKETLAKQIRSSGTLSDGERGYGLLRDIFDVSIETYRNVLDRDERYVASLGFDPTGRKVIYVPFMTLNKYSKEENFSSNVLVDWAYKNGRAYPNFDTNGKAQLMRVKNDSMFTNVVMFYYDWHDPQVRNDFRHLAFEPVLEVIDND